MVQKCQLMKKFCFCGTNWRKSDVLEKNPCTHALILRKDPGISQNVKVLRLISMHPCIQLQVLQYISWKRKILTETHPWSWRNGKASLCFDLLAFLSFKAESFYCDIMSNSRMFFKSGKQRKIKKWYEPVKNNATKFWNWFYKSFKPNLWEIFKMQLIISCEHHRFKAFSIASHFYHW